MVYYVLPPHRKAKLLGKGEYRGKMFFLFSLRYPKKFFGLYECEYSDYEFIFTQCYLTLAHAHLACLGWIREQEKDWSMYKTEPKWGDPRWHENF